MTLWIAPLLLAQASAPVTLVSVDGRLAVKEGASPAVAVNLRRPTEMNLDEAPKSGPWTLVWGQRTLTFDPKTGLSVVEGRRTDRFRILDFLTSPKAFSREEIQANASAISRKTLTREVAAVVGWEPVGEDVYLLLQWQSTTGVPSAEGIFRIPGEEARPRPALLARVPALSMGTAPADRLTRRADQLEWLADLGGAWGVGRWDTVREEAGFRPLGRTPAQAFWRGDGGLTFVETTSYGTRLAGEIDPLGGRRDWMEARGDVRWVSRDPVLLWRTGGEGGSLWFGASSLTVALPARSGLSAVAQGVVVGWPAERPTAGWLMSPEGRIRARFPAPARPATARPAPPRGTPSSTPRQGSGRR